MKNYLHGCITLVLALCAASYGTVRLPAIISDNMVLQADTNVPIWGWADSNETVTVSIAGQTHKTTPDATGKWLVRLDPLHAAGKPAEMTVSGKNSIIVKNILVGEVWVGSGQSNMQFVVSQSFDADAEIKNANYPDIRFFIVTQVTAEKPMENCSGRWVECSPKSAAEFSAVLYFFGRDLYKQVHEPVGLIDSSWGGTLAEAWTSESALRANPAFTGIFENWKKTVDQFNASTEKYKQQLEQLQKEPNAAQLKKLTEPVLYAQNRPASLYNGMIAPLIPYAIKGVVWYQGESNAPEAFLYRTLFPAMITDWRNNWRQGDFGFYFVQLANYKQQGFGPKTSWAELRQAQLETLKLPHTGMAVIIDIGEANNIHPRNKLEVGRRLALIALAKDYGKKIEYSGPIYKYFKTAGLRGAEIQFSHLGGGLVAKNGELHGFTVAGRDKKFYSAKATITNASLSSIRTPADDEYDASSEVKELFGKQGIHVLVTCPDINDVVAIRYAWDDDPEEANLYNAAGLPASPFKTDDWPWLTEKK